MPRSFLTHRPSLLLAFYLWLTIPLSLSAQPSAIKHVVVIGIDGLSPDGIRSAKAPVMLGLCQTGSYTLRARGVLPTSSSPNWASMLTGAGPEQHGITSNDWERDDHTLPPVSTGREAIFPTIFSVIRQQRPTAETGAIYHWDGFGRLIEKSAVNYATPATDEVDAARKAIAYLNQKKPTFTFVHFDHVDHAGHEIGHGTPAYYKAVLRADSLIGEIINTLKTNGMWATTMLLVTADHGGIGKGHGGETLNEIEIPFILAGAGIKKNHPLNFPVYTYDNAATVAFALGLKQPYAWIGRPIKGAFVGFDDPEYQPTMALLPPPTIYPAGVGFASAGGLYIDKPASVTIQAANSETVYYTLDGSEPTPQSTRYTGPFAVQESTVVKAKTIAKGQESATAQAFYRLVSSGKGNGLAYTYYEGQDWHSLADMTQTKPVRTGTTYEFRLDSLQTGPNSFGVEYTGFVQIDKAGEYAFYTYSDDGSRLFIDDKPVVNNDGEHGALEKRGRITLQPGRHAIRVAYFNGGGGGWLDVYYKGPGIAKQMLPASRLFLTK